MVAKKIIKDWMKTRVYTIQPGATVKEAAGLMLEKKIGTLPVVDNEGLLIGIVTMQDIIQVFLPDFVSLLSNVDFIKDYGALKNPNTGTLREVGDCPVIDCMQEPISVEATSGLMRAISMMHKHQIADLSVTEDGKLVGIASGVDIGRGFLSAWYPNKENRS